MASFSGRILRSPLVPTAVVASSLYFSASTLSADEGTSRPVRPGRAYSGDKLPIYPSADHDRPVTLIEVENPLVPHIAQAREAVSGLASEAKDYIQTGVSRWIGFERRVEREVKTVLPADESLTPGLIYVLIAGLSGSVLTRTRSLPIRFLAPPLFTLLSFPYFLPKTSHNVRSYLSQVEDRNFPEFAQKHDYYLGTAKAHSGLLIERIKNVSEDAKGWSQKAVDGVERSTGLKVGQAISRVEQERANDRVVLPAGQKFETVGYVVEQKPVAEIVAPVVETKRAV